MQIETERLTLREFRQEDAAQMLAYWSDPRYRHYYADLDDIEQTVRDLVSRLVAAQGEEPRHVWQLVITDRADGRLLGNCGIRIDDAQLRQANIGYELHPDVWERGYASEAARAILTFGFDHLDVHRVWAECVAENNGSVHVLEKLGMRREAHFREHKWFKGRWWDTRIYAILDHEWRGGELHAPGDHR